MKVYGSIHSGAHSAIDYLPIYIFLNGEQLSRQQFYKKGTRNYVELETKQCLAITEKKENSKPRCINTK